MITETRYKARGENYSFHRRIIYDHKKHHQSFKTCIAVEDQNHSLLSYVILDFVVIVKLDVAANDPPFKNMESELVFK